MKIVFLDAGTLGDFNKSGFEELGQVVLYDYSKPEEVASRVEDADVIITNKVKINKDTLGNYKNLKLVCVSATGTDILDKEFLDRNDIIFTNVADYSTDSVSQLTFSLLLYVMMHSRYYEDYVQSGEYSKQSSFTNLDKPFNEIKGKTWGIIGLGSIGSKVASIATAFGAKVIYYSASGKNDNDTYTRVELDTLLKESDIITLHCPLTEKTRNIINEESINLMKPNVIIVNTSRGALINDEDIVDAVLNHRILAFATDVYAVEPLQADNPLNRIKDLDNVYLTPHIAWSSVEARATLVERLVENIKEFYHI